MKINLIEITDLEKLTAKREGETKIGETIHAGSSIILDTIEKSTANFVIFGIPEDIGPRANCGRGGSDGGWTAFLEKFVNLQENKFMRGASILLLGSIDCSKWNSIDSKDIAQLRKAVESLDEVVSDLVRIIIAANKIPIIIGGGHNNAYGALKGSFQALNQSINCINLDPHADYRAAEGRHSGNSFSYAKSENYLDSYAVLGLDENYNSEVMLQQLIDDGVHYVFFEDVFVRERLNFTDATKQLLNRINDKYYGVELDCDAIENFPSSAQTPSGISPNDARKYINMVGASPNAIYLHLPEAAPSLVADSAAQVGKLLAYLVSDFIKARVQFINQL